jgi:hypothetical protein
MSSIEDVMLALVERVNSLTERVRHLEAAEGESAEPPTEHDAIKLQGVNLSDAAPADGQVLVYDGGAAEWAPANIGALVAGDGSLLTISAGGAITVGGVYPIEYHSVDTYGGAANDSLDTINGGITGQMLVLQNQHASRQISVRDNMGNIQLSALGTTFTLGNPLDKLVLFLAADGTWTELVRANNG